MWVNWEETLQVEATGSVAVANEAINYVRRGGSLLVYSVYAPAPVNWFPAKIFLDEIKVSVDIANWIPRSCLH